MLAYTHTQVYEIIGSVRAKLDQLRSRIVRSIGTGPNDQPLGGGKLPKTSPVQILLGKSPLCVPCAHTLHL